MFDNIPERNRVVFDISHGFRHQPVIASFVISLMRWTHSIKSVEFYSGVFEARQGDIAPVVKLPICQELLEATEAMAILEVTGNYQPLADHLGMDATLPWFMENTNQIANARTPAQRILSDLQKKEKEMDIVGKQLAERLKNRLKWSQESTFADRVRRSARTALNQGDYLRAIILTYEAILVRSGQLLYPGDDPLDYQTREKAQQELYQRLVGFDHQILNNLRKTRNACAHGSRADWADVQNILRNPDEFRQLIKQAFELYDRFEQLLFPSS